MTHAVSSILGGIATIFGGGGDNSPPPAPAVTPPPVIPLPNDQAVQLAKKKEIASQVAASGRASTVLTQQDNATDKLGS